MTRDVHLRLPSPLRDRLAAFARDTRRTINGAAELLLSEALDRREEAKS